MTQRLAVIFDVDGVLVDSYHVHFQSWREAAARYGFSMSEEQFAATFGRTSREIIQQLWSDALLSDDQITEIDALKESAYREIIAADFPVMPGAAELIQELAASGFKLAVGSSGPPENVELSLEHLGTAALFGAAVTGRDVSRGKPDPQVFQIAAERLGVPPARCAVIEDAAAGIAAANAAGMLSIALVSTGHARNEFSAADHIVDRLDQLTPPQLSSWLTRRSD